MDEADLIGTDDELVMDHRALRRRGLSSRVVAEVAGDDWSWESDDGQWQVTSRSDGSRRSAGRSHLGGDDYDTVDDEWAEAAAAARSSRWAGWSAVALAGSAAAILGAFGAAYWASQRDDGVADEAAPVTSEPAVSIPVAPDVSEADEADMLDIRIEPPDADEAADGELVPATATIRSDGLLYFEGAFASRAVADRYVSQAAAIFGDDAIVEDYVIDPAAPEPQASDVTLSKPVLFETDSAEIHPDFIPYLEACAGVLELNPDITMSISAFTDSVGDADYNLELSRQRAEAIYDFYASLDIGSDQLVAVGLGESDPVADNESDEGRAANRRAMLELLDVMADEAG